MAHTKKVGIAGKYGTRYGATLRKEAGRIEAMASRKYICPLCNKATLRKTAAGIWTCRCKHCRHVVAGGAWQPRTQAATTVQNTLARLTRQAAALKGEVEQN